MGRQEPGFTLVELLVAATLGLVVVGGAVTIFVSGIRSEPRTASKVAAIQQARVTLDRITRELRQGIEISATPAPSPTQLGIVTYVKNNPCGGAATSVAIPCKVTYTCSGTSCTRVVAQPDGSAPGPSSQAVDDLSSSSVFSYLPDAKDPSYVGVDFAVSSPGGDSVALSDGVALRNQGEEP